jgi:phenylalanyl-tRNA synthetase beta chain
VGYDRIVPAPPLAPVVLVPRRPLDELARRIRATLAGACGMDEVQTYSFDSGALLRKLGFEPPAPLRLRNAISADLATLRTDLAPNLLGVIERNATRLAEFGAFELGRVFASARDAEGIPAQEHRLGMVFYDRAARAAPAAETLYRHSRGVLEHLLGRLDVSGVRVGGDWQGPRTPWMHPGATAAVAAGDSMLGYLVRVHPATLKALDQPGTAVLAELSLDAILSAPRQAPRFVTVPRFPSIQADISLLADDSLRSGDLAAVARREAGALCVAIDLVAIYSGPPIPEGRRSLTWRMTFQAPDRTLEDAEVQAAVTRVVAAAKGMGASRRE